MVQPRYSDAKYTVPFFSHSPIVLAGFRDDSQCLASSLICTISLKFSQIPKILNSTYNRLVDTMQIHRPSQTNTAIAQQRGRYYVKFTKPHKTTDQQTTELQNHRLPQTTQKGRNNKIIDYSEKEPQSKILNNYLPKLPTFYI